MKNTLPLKSPCIFADHHYLLFLVNQCLWFLVTVFLSGWPRRQLMVSTTEKNSKLSPIMPRAGTSTGLRPSVRFKRMTLWSVRMLKWRGNPFLVHGTEKRVTSVFMNLHVFKYVAIIFFSQRSIWHFLTETHNHINYSFRKVLSNQKFCAQVPLKLCIETTSIFSLSC